MSDEKPPSDEEILSQTFTPGLVAPKDGPPEGKEQETPDYGPNFERLKELEPDLVNQLFYLVSTYNDEDYHSRRQEVIRVRRAREFWKGNHYSTWDETLQEFVLPFSVGGAEVAPNDSEEIPRYAYVVNIFQAFGLAIIAVFSRRPPNVKLWPQSAQQPEDVSVAKVGSDVIDLIQKNNKVVQLLIDLSYVLWVDGMAAGYVRYVTDAERFGTHKEPILAESTQEIPASYLCPSCGSQTPVSPTVTPVCQSCGEPLSPESLSPAQSVSVPVTVGYKEVPNGQEEITILGKLEVKVPTWADRFEDFPYLIWSTEAHRAKIRAQFPHVSHEIAVQSVGPGSAIGGDHYDRTTRLSLKTGSSSAIQTDPISNLVTYTQTWLRPWAFWLVEDVKVREKLLELFPKGCYVAFAGDTFCQARNEAMGDHWRIMHAYPGDGQSRPSMGESLIPINQRLNDATNLQQETYEFGIPPTFMDSQMYDRQSLQKTKVMPGSMYFVKPRMGQSVRDGVFTPPASQVPPDFERMIQMLFGPMAQFLTGAFPALFGGELAGNDTAAGYAMARDQAMGRLGLVWEAVKSFWAGLMMLGLECFRANRLDDVETPLEGEGGDFESKFIRIADLRGNLFATPDTEDSFPQMFAQLKATLQGLMQSDDPKVQEVLDHPVNLKLSKRVLGLDQFVIPDEESESKQYREIKDMSEKPPSLVPGKPQLGPDGAPMIGVDNLPVVGPPSFKSSVPVDPVVDVHPVEIAVCRRWLNSAAGLEAKKKQPLWYENVRAHLVEHETAAMERAMSEAMLNAPQQVQEAQR